MRFSISLQNSWSSWYFQRYFCKKRTAANVENTQRFKKNKKITFTSVILDGNAPA